MFKFNKKYEILSELSAPLDEGRIVRIYGIYIDGVDVIDDGHDPKISIVCERNDEKLVDQLLDDANKFNRLPKTLVEAFLLYTQEKNINIAVVDWNPSIYLDFCRWLFSLVNKERINNENNNSKL